MTLRTYPDPVLRKKTDRVNAVGSEERAILDEMAKTMYLTQGVGLAATQVGLDKTVCRGQYWPWPHQDGQPRHHQGVREWRRRKKAA